MPDTSPAATSSPGAPGIARLGRAQRPILLVAVPLGACAVVATTLARLWLPENAATAGGSADAATQVYGWAVAAIVAAVLITLICVLQLVAWARAIRGDDSADTAGDDAEPETVTTWRRISFGAHLVSYPLVLIGMFGALTVFNAVGVAGASGPLALVALLALVAAQTLGAVNYVRPGGPAGTVPAHLRRLAEADRVRRQAGDRA